MSRVPWASTGPAKTTKSNGPLRKRLIMTNIRMVLASCSLYACRFYITDASIANAGG
jgi:hypothetical protein